MNALALPCARQQVGSPWVGCLTTACLAGLITCWRARLALYWAGITWYFVISCSFLLAISGPPAQLCILRTQTLEHSYSEHYSVSPDLYYVSPFLSPFWFVYIHTSSHFVYSSDPVPGCVHHSGLWVPSAQPRHLLWMFISPFDLVVFLLCTAPMECLTSKHSFYFPCCAWLIYIDSLDKPFSYHRHSLLISTPLPFYGCAHPLSLTQNNSH